MWWKKFVEKEGSRLFWLLLAASFAVAFMFTSNEKLEGTGVTLLSGLATYLLTRIRSEAPIIIEKKEKETVTDD